jgi:hypothetical protein
MADETAEEKLLKMMKKSSAPAGVKPSPVASKKKFKLTFSVNALNKFLFLGIIVCLVILGFELRSGFTLLRQPVIFPREASGLSLSENPMPSTRSSNYYLQQINERNIFKPYVPKVAKKAAVQGLVVMMAKYKLVGIAWLDLPETASVMIEEIQKHKTFFLKVGEQIEGVTVKTIYTDRAVFSHENEEITIKL